MSNHNFKVGDKVVGTIKVNGVEMPVKGIFSLNDPDCLHCTVFGAMGVPFVAVNDDSELTKKHYHCHADKLRLDEPVAKGIKEEKIPGSNCGKKCDCLPNKVTMVATTDTNKISGNTHKVDSSLEVKGHANLPIILNISNIAELYSEAVRFFLEDMKDVGASKDDNNLIENCSEILSMAIAKLQECQKKLK